MSSQINRRRFLRSAVASVGITAAAGSLGADGLDEYVGGGEEPPERAEIDFPQGREEYKGPNVILIRFGGGVRPLETITEPQRTYCPFIYHELATRHGMLFPNMVMDPHTSEVVTSHGEGTLYILTGRYHHYQDIENQFLGSRFEPIAPTIFEYFRRKYNVPAHQALLVNGEDRIAEEFYTHSQHHQFGIRYKSTVLSLFRYKTYLYREQLKNPDLNEHQRRRLQFQLEQMEERDYRSRNRNSVTVSSEKLNDFWAKWRRHYGDSGLVNPRGDRLLTTLAMWALRELRPKLMMINYQDPDYVHWGRSSFYTRAVSIIDDGVRELWNTIQNDDEYRDNTVFVVVPDCGRDNNRCAPVPFQHHFNAHEIFGIIAGPQRLGIQGTRPYDREVQQTSMTKTIGDLMGFDATEAQAESLISRL